MAKDTFYFSHDYNTRSDEKIKRLIRKHGMLGYGVFWSIIEDLYNNANEMQTDCEGIAYEYRIGENIVESIINDFDLFILNGDTFGSMSVQRRLDERDAKSAKARESARKRWDGNTNVMQSQCERIDIECKGNAIKESKVKESKVKDILNKGDKPQLFNFKKSLIDLGVEKQIADDWMKVRSKKKASNTETAFKSIKTNIEKSKVSANECIKIAVEKDWRGFEASWLTNRYNDKPKPQITDKQAYVNRKMGLDEPDDGIERLFYVFKGDGWVNRYFSPEELEDFIVRTQSEVIKSSQKRM